MPSFLHSVATARLASLRPLSAPSIPSLGAGIRRDRGDPSVPPQALTGLLLAHVQVVRKKHPMKCAGVAGRQVRARVYALDARDIMPSNPGGRVA